jgi:hypothetical protein
MIACALTGPISGSASSEALSAVLILIVVPGASFVVAADAVSLVVVFTSRFLQVGCSGYNRGS